MTTHAFDAKCLRGGAPAGESLVGSADLQSLADLGGSFELVQAMLPAPVTKAMVIHLAMATLAPMLPLALTRALGYRLHGMDGFVPPLWGSSVRHDQAVRIP